MKKIGSSIQTTDAYDELLGQNKKIGIVLGYDHRDPAHVYRVLWSDRSELSIIHMSNVE